MVNHIGDNYIKFTSYNEEDTISLYSFEVSNNSLNILFRGKYQNIKLLDERYAILSKDFIFGEDHYLLDIDQNEIYKISSIELENSFFYNTRVLDIRDEKYLVHTKYSLDTYDLDYHFDYSELKSGDSGVYIISYNEFINNIKNNEKVCFMTVMESSEFSYINAVNYDDLIHNIEHYKNYHFININNKNKEVELYRIIIDNKEIIKELETTVSYREYSNLDRIFASDYPVTITKTSWLYACDEFRQFYPFEFIDRGIRDNNESVIDILDEYIIYYVWNELSDNSYYEYTRIRNRDDRSVYMDIYGIGLIMASISLISNEFKLLSNIFKIIFIYMLLAFDSNILIPFSYTKEILLDIALNKEFNILNYSFNFLFNFFINSFGYFIFGIIIFKLFERKFITGRFFDNLNRTYKTHNLLKK